MSDGSVPRPPEAIRERVDRLGGGRVAAAVIFDREFTPDEIRRFSAFARDGEPGPTEFRIEGRVARYECDEADEARFRLALEILLVKALRDAPRSTRPTGDVRTRFGLRPMHR